MTISPTSLTLKHLRAEGWPLVEKVEHWDAFAHKTHDLFGFVDVVALGPKGTLGVQTTSASNVAARVKKMADSPNIAAVREAGWSLVVHGWEKRQGRWVLARCLDVS